MLDYGEKNGIFYFEDEELFEYGHGVFVGDKFELYFNGEIIHMLPDNNNIEVIRNHAERSFDGEFHGKFVTTTTLYYNAYEYDSSFREEYHENEATFLLEIQDIIDKL